MTLTLTSEIEKALAEAASRHGTTPEGLALDCLRERFVPPTGGGKAESAETLADFLAGHLGVLASSEHVPGGANLSTNSGQRFKAGLVERRKQGRQHGHL